MTYLKKQVPPTLIVSLGIFLIGEFLGLVLAHLYLSANMISQIAVQPNTNINALIYIEHNLIVWVSLILGGFTFGIVTVIFLFSNGFWAGAVQGAVIARYGVGFLLVGLVPHGILEVTSYCLAGYVGLMIGILYSKSIFRSWPIMYQKFFGTSNSKLGEIQHQSSTWSVLLLQKYLKILAWSFLLLIIAGFFEAYVSPRLLLLIR